MTDQTLQDYWTLVAAHRRGSKDALIALELMTYGTGKASLLARQYCAEHPRKPAPNAKHGTNVTQRPALKNIKDELKSHVPATLSLDRLEEEISRIERVLVVLESDDPEHARYVPYRLRNGSPGHMTGGDLKRQIEKLYPSIECTVLSEHLPLSQLRLRHSP